ncbi:hypothetical protein T552_01271 [Pneumocystis carinii B80]|uniref:Sugar phosphate transporter domain-containing protein n=1 Tax=Pneumocystis carinii (strain B80) TaxID=1408658 RepID=A0A0W4ZLT0_PNEC8|nr:hypothetical protein T552_01271 [Pneumocystis carinii B80]KTW29316.1 hypothetical protein T552_01271 [Pneumocystis carinii B80]
MVHIPLYHYFLILFLIFGGCCSNIFSLEAIIKKLISKGLLITFLQFLYITIEGLVYNFFTGSTFLVKRNVPIGSWMIIVSLFFTATFLNNKAYSYGISIPMHIITQSGGIFILVILEWLYINKKPDIYQMISIAILTSGVIIANISNISEKHSINLSMIEYTRGIIILLIAQILRSFMSIYMEKTFKLYSPNWKEVNFYMHFFSLLLYMPILPKIYSQTKLLNYFQTPFISQKNHDRSLYEFLKAFLKFKIPKTSNYLFYFCINIITQSLCVQGINRLNVISTALTANIILNLRKFISLILSIYIFENKRNFGTISGIILVFTGSIWYSIEVHKKKAINNKSKKS